MRLRTQWVPSFAGPPVGLDYAKAYPLIDRLSTADAEWWELFSDLQVLEMAALEQMHADHQPAA